jgi:putative DNA primase/helicase
MASVRKIAAALNGAPDGDGWVCRCPAHPDANPSLRVVDHGGKTLVYCRAGCTQSAVITALKKLGLWKRWGRGPARQEQQTDSPAPAQGSLPATR